MRWLGGGLAALALLVLIAVLGVGRWLEAPGGEPGKSDVIVVLGGDSEARLVTALALYREQWAPTIFLVGKASTARAHDPPAPQARLRYLLENDVPAAAIVVDEEPRNSREEAIATLAAMRRAGWRSALVVSDPPHMRRLSLIWPRAMGATGYTYALVPSAPPWWQRDAWWRDAWSRQFVESEVAKIGYYAVVP